MGPPQKMIHGAGFRRGGVGCGWKGIPIALTMESTIAFAIRSVDRSLDRTYRMECDRGFLPAHCGLS